MKIMTYDDYNALSCEVAKKAASYIKKGGLMCFAAGDTPMGMLRELIKMQKRGEVNLSAAHYISLDEWIGLGPDDEGSCIKIMNENFYRPAGIPPEQIWLFDGLNPDTDKQCREAEKIIESHSGISFALLGIGMNGHIGFNEPGTPETPGCFTVDLDDTTKSVSEKYFGKALPVTRGITIGWKELLNSKSAVLMASGIEKAAIIKAAVKGTVSMDVPASFFQKHRDITVMLDTNAASML